MHGYHQTFPWPKDVLTESHGGSGYMLFDKELRAAVEDTVLGDNPLFGDLQ